MRIPSLRRWLSDNSKAFWVSHLQHWLNTSWFEIVSLSSRYTWFPMKFLLHYCLIMKTQNSDREEFQ